MNNWSPPSIELNYIVEFTSMLFFAISFGKGHMTVSHYVFIEPWLTGCDLWSNKSQLFT